jgi:hypothetical protein
MWDKLRDFPSSLKVGAILEYLHFKICSKRVEF